MTLADKFQKSLEEKWNMRFLTDHPDEDRFDGVVTANQEEFIVLRQESDLTYDGVVVLPKRVISGYRDGDAERSFNRVLRHAGELQRARSPIWLNDCGSLVEVLGELKQRDIWPGLEVVWEGEEERISSFNVGPIVYVEQDRFGIHSYDAEGVWDDEVIDVELEEVFKILINDRYTTRFNAYMRDLGPDRPL